MKPNWSKAACSALFLLCYLPCKAQLEISAGPVLSLPQIIVASGKLVDAWQIRNGLCLGLIDNPKELQFFPSIRFSFGQLQLPIQQDGTDLGALTFGYYSLMLNGVYTVSVRQTRHLLLYGGLGMLSLTEKYIPSNSSSSSNLIVGVDSITNATHISPSTNIGVEYKGKTFGKYFCLSMGLNLQYTSLIYGRNNYYLLLSGTGTTSYHERASLVGNLFQPTVYFTISYKAGKTKSSWYL